MLRDRGEGVGGAVGFTFFTVGLRSRNMPESLFFFTLNTEAAIHTHTFSPYLSLHPSGPGRSRKY